MPTLKPQVLVVDDDLDIQSFLLLTLSPFYRIKAVGVFDQALTELARSSPNPYDLILSDILLPGVSEVQLVGELSKHGFDLPVIVMTAQGSIENAVAAMKNGVFDYILKPLDIDDLRISINRALRVRSLETENSILRQEVKRSWSLGKYYRQEPRYPRYFQSASTNRSHSRQCIDHGRDWNR